MNVVFIYDVGYVPLQSKHERRNVSSDLTFHVEKKKVVYRRFTICRQLSVCGIENAHIQPVHDQVRMRVSALWACASVCVCVCVLLQHRHPDCRRKKRKIQRAMAVLWNIGGVSGASLNNYVIHLDKCLIGSKRCTAALHMHYDSLKK